LPEAVCHAVEVPTVFDPEDLRERGLFTGPIRVTYRVWRILET